MNDFTVILQEIEGVLKKVREEEVDRFITDLSDSVRIFVIGEGRSGFAIKSFAMRLMHLGLQVYVHGETITPSIQSGDLLIAASGSGSTPGVIVAVQSAKRLNVRISVLTVHSDSLLASLADHVVRIPAATKYRQQDESVSQQALGTLYDQCLHIILDGVCLRINRLRGETAQEIFDRHSNMG